MRTIITLLTIALVNMPVIAEAKYRSSFSSGSRYRATPSYKAAPQPSKPAVQPKTTVSKTTPAQSNSVPPKSNDSPGFFSPNFWFWMFLFGTASSTTNACEGKECKK